MYVRVFMGHIIWTDGNYCCVHLSIIILDLYGAIPQRCSWHKVFDVTVYEKNILKVQDRRA